MGEKMSTSESDVGRVEDRRCTNIRHLNMVYSFTAPKSRREWQARAKYIREQILTGCGLLPMPEKTPLNARIFGRIERGDYSIEKVFFESFPGFYVTGNLYRPLGKRGPFPAILNTHGHWAPGRLVNNEYTNIPRRCANMAKQGYIAFSYDMIGFCDSTQVEHRKGQLDTPRAHLWGISIGGLQLWNSIRAVDFLCSLPDVDKTRIACTGASGGGTQTFLLSAVDDRVKFAAPVNMISSIMQGGCQCENPPLIRLDTNNMEIGALAAPRPLFLVAATGDWTVNTPTTEFPAIQSVYKLFGAEDKVAYVQFEAEHNYNKESREAVYAFFGRWMLRKNDPDAFREQDTYTEKDEDLLVFAHEPRPSDALDDKGIIESRILSAQKQIEASHPHDSATLEAFRNTYGLALMHCLSPQQVKPSDLVVESRGVTHADGYTLEKLIIGRKACGDRVPGDLYEPQGCQTKRRAILIVSSHKSNLGDSKLVRGLLNRGQSVLAIECFNTGENVCSQDRTTKYAFFTTYNRTDTAERVQDILTALAYLHSRKDISQINLLGIGDGGLWVMLASAFAPEVNCTVVDANGFDSNDDDSYIERLFVPCIRRAGDFRTASALICPRPLYVHNTRGRFQTDWMHDAYVAAGAPGALKVRGTPAHDDDILQWLESQDKLH